MGRWAQASRRGGVSHGLTTGTVIPPPVVNVDYTLTAISGGFQIESLLPSGPAGFTGLTWRWKLHTSSGYSNAGTFIAFEDLADTTGLGSGLYDIKVGWCPDAGGAPDNGVFGPINPLVIV